MPEAVSFDRVLLVMLLVILAKNITATNLKPNDLLDTMKDVEGWLSETHLSPDLRKTIQQKINEIKGLATETDWASQAQAPLYKLVSLLSYTE